MAKQKLVVGNWKMNPPRLKKAKEVFQKNAQHAKKLMKARAVLCVPFPYLYPLSALSRPSRLTLGGQDLFWEKEGSHTGEVSPVMLKGAEATHVVIGHSERRALGEDDAVVSRKTNAALEHKLLPVVCIGEDERDNGGSYYSFLSREIERSLAGVSAADFKKITVAYEPIWAIGKSADEAMTGEDMRQMNIFIRKVIADAWSKDAADAVRVIYGGSVDSSNVRDIIEEGHIDGVLPGRASRDPKEFAGILQVADELSK